MNDFCAPETVPAGIRERVRIGLPGSWVVAREIDEEFLPGNGSPVSVLLSDRQHHAELGERYERSVHRLQTVQAVHEAAQWRLDFDPRTQRLVIHSLVVRHEGRNVENAQLDRLRFLQREENLERLVISGHVTMVVLLEDVRVGDILDVSFTVQTEPRLLAHRYWFLSGVPSYAPLRAFYLSVRFASERPFKWKTDAGEFAPSVREMDGETEWTWLVENALPPEPESGVPPWHLSGRWMQVSDCESWAEVAAAVHAAWTEDFGDERLAGVVREIAAASKTPQAAAERALTMVQDEIRYLSVNIELGGQIPESPGEVLRRHFGDCKDKTFLLVHMLRRLGISARPVLVHSQLGLGIEQLLPMPDAFDHAVIEYEIEGRRRLVDATLPQQGGGALARSAPSFGAGLPIGPDVDGLARYPISANRVDSYELREVFHLDTTNRPVSLAVTVTARGCEADRLRRAFALEGAGAVGKRREQFFQQLFPEARRVGLPEWRDDREFNEFVLAEMFDLPNALILMNDRRVLGFQHRAHLIQLALSIPEQTNRRQPFALPFPCQFVHSIEFVSPSLSRTQTSKVLVQESAYDFRCEWTQSKGRWIVRYTLKTLAPFVAAGHFERHKKRLLEWWSCTQLGLLIPVGTPVPRRKGDAGSLLPAARTIEARALEACAQTPAAPGDGTSLPEQPAPPLCSRPKVTEPAPPEVSSLPSPRDTTPNVAAKAVNPSSPRRSRRRSRKRIKPLRLAFFVIAAFAALVVVMRLWSQLR